MKLRLCLAILTMSISAGGQVFKYGNGKTLTVEFVQEPPCAVNISVVGTDLTNPDPNRHQILLGIQNTSKSPIRVLALVSGGDQHPTVHTMIFPTTVLEPGTRMQHGIWPNSQEHYYFFFDYVLYADGSVCGMDNHRRSTQIAAFLAARDAALKRVRELMDGSNDGQAIMNLLETQAEMASTSTDNAGPPDPSRVRSMPNLAWAQVVLQLREMTTRYKVAGEVAEKMQREIPSIVGDISKE